MMQQATLRRDPRMAGQLVTFVEALHIQDWEEEIGKEARLGGADSAKWWGWPKHSVGTKRF